MMTVTKERGSRSRDQRASQDNGTIEARLIKAVRDLAIELHPENRRITVTRSSDLDRDLGFDSLSRAELMLRIEQTFDVKLPENLLVEAETVRDLHQAIMASGSAAAMPAAAAVDIPTEAAVEPVDAGTLIDVLEMHAEAHPDRTHVAVRGEDGREHVVTYGMLHDAACKVAAGLRAKGLTSGDRISVMLPTGAEFFYAFFGVLFAGGIPVPVYPPMRMSQLEDHLRRQAGILRNARASLLITDERILPLSTVMRGLVGDLRDITTVERLSAAGTIDRPHAAAPGDTALIQYTSGSTGDPKGVVLTHANLLANIRAMGAAVEVTSADVFVSWLPLYHDMGLIGAWLGSLYYGIAAVIMSPVSFLAAPRNWLNTINRYRATLSASPNFGFELCLKRLRDRDLESLDLSSLRMVVNGAEPISPDTLRRFTERLGTCGLAPGAVAPVYGLAESSVGLAFPPLDRLPIIDRVDRDAMSASGEARPAPASDATALEFVACGQPLQGHEIRIVDTAGRELPERRQGRLEFRGPSTTSGYYRDEEKTRRLFNGDWLDSGDLAYVAGGDIFITGRIKDIIIRAGRNIYPHELEQHVGALDGIRKGCVAVFPSKDPRSATETLVVLAETRETGDEKREALRRAVSDAALDLVELPPDEIVLVPPRTIPKTSSGKIRRAAARELYERHELTPHARALWLQLMRLSIEGAGRRLRSAWNRAAAYAYAGYWWAALCGLSAAVWLSVLILPSRPW
ncbi:MAG: AMP-binding protein, partial [Hyphomicrobiales bacterium]